MVPEHLTFQLLSMQETEEAKTQRNTQAELLAILMSILMWHKDLQGQSLLVLTDSTAALDNCRVGTAADQQSRDLVSLILFMGAIFRIHIWFDWVPSKQNPGDPYSRPETGTEEVARLHESMKATNFEASWPSFIRAGPTVWRKVMSSEHPPNTWSVSKQVETLVDLGVATPQEFSMALLHSVNPDKAQVLRLGHWPRFRATNATPHTVFALQLTKLLLQFGSIHAPRQAITAILVEQSKTSLHTIREPVCALRIEPGEMRIGVRSSDNRWRTVSTCQIPNEDRHLSVFLGTNQQRIPQKQQMQLKKAGFSLMFL
jgi:hypothetical protein